MKAGAERVPDRQKSVGVAYRLGPAFRVGVGEESRETGVVDVVVRVAVVVLDRTVEVIEGYPYFYSAELLN